MELALKVKDSNFESVLVFFMFLFKSQNLVVGLFTEALSVIGQVVKLLNLFNCVVYLSNVALVNSGLVAKLFPPNVNFASQNLVLSLKIIIFS